MTPYQEKRLLENLDAMAKELLAFQSARPRKPEHYQHVGAAIYLLWETRQLLKLPEIPGLNPC